MQFPVPQFIDIEDKIIGPFSLKQFGFLFVGGLIIVALFRMMGGVSALFIILALPVFAATLALTFAKFNGRPLYDSFSIFLGFASAPRNLVFQKKGDIDDLKIQPISVELAKNQPAKALTPEELEGPQSKLKRLSRLLQQKEAERLEIINQNKPVVPVEPAADREFKV